MSAKNHPDYSEEVKRLVETRKAVEEWLGKAQSSRGATKNYRRLEKTRQVLRRELKRKTEEVVKQAEQYYDEKNRAIPFPHPRSREAAGTGDPPDGPKGSGA